MNIIQLPGSGIQIDDGSKKDGHIDEESTFTYEKREIEQHFIDECEKRANETGETHFLFDTKLSHLIKRKSIVDKEDKRESDLSEILESEVYHIGTEMDFNMMPSRCSYYDTETQLKCRYEKYTLVVNFLKSLGFKPSEFNLGPEMEQSYILDIREDESLHIKEKFIIRIKPNLFLKVIYQNFDKYFGSNTIYNGFFSKKKIFEAFDEVSDNITKILIRDAKIEDILS